MSDSQTVNTNQIIGCLDGLSTRTEEIFLKLGRSLPALFREIEGGVTKANHLIEVFSKESTACDYREQDHLIINSIERAKTLVGDASDFFIALETRDSRLFDVINSSIDSLAALENQFIDIREASIDMEVVSLNAKIAALKAGKHSAGFACISDELRKLSSATTNNTEILTKRGEDVLQNLTSFTSKIENKIENIQSGQQSFYKQFRENIKKIFKNYNHEVEGLVEHLDSAITEAESVKGPLGNIMEIIQLQDIIRQSLQHVELVLKESDIKTISGTPRQILDELTFIKILYQLCGDLLEDIREKISESINTFSVNISDLREILDKVNMDSECAEGFSSPNNEDDKPGDELTQIVSESVETLEVLLKKLGASMKKKISIPIDAKQIIDTLKSLEDGFAASLAIVSRFYPININARVEVAKWDSLNQVGIATGEMSDVTDRINRDMKTALQMIRKIKKEIESSITLYTSGNADEITAIDGITGRIKECYDELSRSSEILSDTIHSFSVYSKSFFTLLDNSELEIERLSELIDVINDIRGTLCDSGNALDVRKNKILSEIGMEKWEVKDSKLEEIINKFTIYAHKQTAEDIAGIGTGNRKEAGAAGELTLF
ncbi:MAG: hypothetical protein KAR21_23470 [Spirochaetales bacterium]|nr:hypothetical protein [Spirochaetales bacterium]